MRHDYLMGTVLITSALLSACGGSGGSGAMPNQNSSIASELGNAELVTNTNEVTSAGNATSTTEVTSAGNAASSNSSTSTPATDTAVTTDLDIGAKYVGLYIKGCDWTNHTDSSDGWKVITYTLNRDMMSTEVYYYNDPQCSEPNSPASMLTESSLVYPGGIRKTPMGNGDFINITHETVMIDNEPATQQVVEQLASEGYFDTSYSFINNHAFLDFGDTEGDLNGSTPELRPVFSRRGAPHSIYFGFDFDFDSERPQVPGASASIGADTARGYNGNYIRGCTLLDEQDESEGWTIDQLDIDGNEFTFLIDYYSDSSCTQSGLTSSATVEGFLRYTGGQILTPLGNANFVNVTPLKVTFNGLPNTREEEKIMAELGLFDSTFDLILRDGDTLYTGELTATQDAKMSQRRPFALDFMDAMTVQ